jgi:hypothetical protein
MKEDLERLIRDAQRQMRVVSGGPLLPDELEAERRDRETKALETALGRDLEYEIMLNLFPKVQWEDDHAIATFVIDQMAFRVWKDQQGRYKLTAGDDAQELLDTPANDPLLRARFLTALGNHLAKPQDSQNRRANASGDSVPTREHLACTAQTFGMRIRRPQTTVPDGAGVVLSVAAPTGPVPVN